VGKE
jgi:hypothetical protein